MRIWMFDSWWDVPQGSFSVQIYKCIQFGQHWVKQGLPWSGHPTSQTPSSPYGSLCIEDCSRYRYCFRCSRTWTYALRSGHTSGTKIGSIHSRWIIEAKFGNGRLSASIFYIGLVVILTYAWPLKPCFLISTVTQLL